MIRNWLVAIAIVLLFGSAAIAEGLKIHNLEEEYVTKVVTAKNVKGIRVGLSKAAFRDCNQKAIVSTFALVSGDGAGWNDKYFLDGHMITTLINCPPEDTLGKETLSLNMDTLYSNPIFIKSFSNKNVHNEVHVIVVIPKEFQLKVVEVTHSPSEEGETDADPSK